MCRLSEALLNSEAVERIVGSPDFLDSLENSQVDASASARLICASAPQPTAEIPKPVVFRIGRFSVTDWALSIVIGPVVPLWTVALAG